MTRFLRSSSLAAPLLSLVAAMPALADTVVRPETRALLSKPDASPALALGVSPAHFGRGANGVMASGHF